MINILSQEISEPEKVLLKEIVEDDFNDERRLDPWEDAALDALEEKKLVKYIFGPGYIPTSRGQRYYDQNLMRMRLAVKGNS